MSAIKPVRWARETLVAGYAMYGVFYLGHYLGCWALNSEGVEAAKANGLEVEAA